MGRIHDKPYIALEQLFFMQQPLHNQSESKILYNLLQSHEKFKTFYDYERTRVGKIKWDVDPTTLKSLSAKAAHTYDKNINCHKIIISNIPSSSDDDAYSIAHELMHAILSNENMSLRILERNVLNAGTLKPYISSMLEDPVVDSVLQKYDFDLLSVYSQKIKSIKLYWNGRGESSHEILLLISAAQIACMEMQIERLNDKNLMENWYAFLLDLKKNNQKLYSMSQGFISIMHDRIDKLENKREVFMTLSETYGIKKYLYIDE